MACNVVPQLMNEALAYFLSKSGYILLSYCSSIVVSKSCAASKSSNTQFDDDSTASSIE